MNIDQSALVVGVTAFALIVSSRLLFQGIQNKLYNKGTLEESRKFQRFLERCDSFNILPLLWMMTFLGVGWWATRAILG